MSNKCLFGSSIIHSFSWAMWFNIDRDDTNISHSNYKCQTLWFEAMLFQVEKFITHVLINSILKCIILRLFHQLEIDRTTNIWFTSIQWKIMYRKLILDKFLPIFYIDVLKILSIYARWWYWNVKNVRFTSTIFFSSTHQLAMKKNRQNS